MSVKPAYILLSSYNGEKYIQDQIDSLLSQTYENTKIVIRDDGSTDLTLQILKDYEKRYENIKVNYGKNIGVKKSFLVLLANVPKDAEYICFCDQDDLWHNSKISRAVNFLNNHKNKIPLMYCSSLNVVDENLNHLYTKHMVKKKPSFSNSIVENIATGCTIVFNRSAFLLLKNKTPDHDKIIMHDWWVYMVISAFGYIIYDKSPMVSYRQHNYNVIGIDRGFKFWHQRYKRFISNENNIISKQVKEFIKIYSKEIDGNKESLIFDFFNIIESKNIFKRILLTSRIKIYRQNLMDDLIFRLLLILKRL